MRNERTSEQLAGVLGRQMNATLSMLEEAFDTCPTDAWGQACGDSPAIWQQQAAHEPSTDASQECNSPGPAAGIGRSKCLQDRWPGRQVLPATDRCIPGPGMVEI